MMTYISEMWWLGHELSWLLALKLAEVYSSAPESTCTSQPSHAVYTISQFFVPTLLWMSSQAEVGLERR